MYTRNTHAVVYIYTAIYTAIYTYQNPYPLTLHSTREDNKKNEIIYFYLSHCICKGSRP